MPTRFLIADDNHLWRRSLRQLIEQHPGWIVCAEADDGLQAVANALESRPDFVVLDFAMPRLDGIRAAHEIRQAMPEVVVLLCTIHEAEAVQSHALAAGIQGLLPKSDVPAQFTGMVERMLTERHTEPESARIDGTGKTGDEARLEVPSRSAKAATKTD